MFLSTLSAAMLLGAPPTPLKMVVFGASLFKDGYAVVRRKATLDGDGEYVVSDIPQAALGTIWLQTDANTVVDSVVATNETNKADVPVSSIQEVLAANLGKIVTLTQGDGKLVTGTLVSVQPSAIVLKTDDQITVIGNSNFTSVTGAGLTTSLGREGSQRVLSFKVHSHPGGLLQILTLERGMTWAPSYGVDIEGGKLHVRLRATIVDDRAPLDHVPVELVTGYANLPFAGVLDPLVRSDSMDGFLNDLNAGLGAPAMAGALVTQRLAFSNNAVAAPMAAMPMPRVTTTSAEDLFLYHLEGVSLKAGDRSTQVIADDVASFKHVYTWDPSDTIVNPYNAVPDEPIPQEVWHCAEFENPFPFPMTTAPATTYRQGELLGQDTLDYTSKGATVTLRITRALDIRPDGIEREVKREVIAIPGLKGPWSKVTVEGTLRVANPKPEPILMRITKRLVGSLVASDHKPTTRKESTSMQSVNARTDLVWNETVKSQASLTITYTYSYVVRQ